MHVPSQFSILEIINSPSQQIFVDSFLTTLSRSFSLRCLRLCYCFWLRWLTPCWSLCPLFCCLFCFLVPGFYRGNRGGLRRREYLILRWLSPHNNRAHSFLPSCSI